MSSPQGLFTTFMDLAQIRLDFWNRLLEAADRMRSQPARRGEVEGLLDLVEPFERYWVFPGKALLARLRQRLGRNDAELFHEELNLVVKALGEYGDRAALFGDLDDLEKLSRNGLPRERRHYFTVLLVGDLPEARVETLRAGLREAQREGSEFCYDVLAVSNLEDALAAAAFNYDVQAVVTFEDFPLRADGAPDTVRGLIDEYVATLGGAADGPRGHLLAQALRELRPPLDLYLMSPVSGAATERRGRERFDRVFYRLENTHEIHMTVVAGVRERYRTPFFDALKNYAQRPIGNFHALPIARGHSILNSKWIEDMGEFYGTNIFMAETSTTSGGLDSLLEPTGTIMEAQQKAAKTWGSQHTFFATNGTSTSNKIVVQGLTGPGDIVLIDRNCHKSHHYGMILGGAHPLYLDAYPLEPYAMYGAVPLRTIKKTLLELRAAGRLDRVKMLLLTNCTFDGQTYNPQRVMEEVLAIKPDMVFLWDEAWYAFARFLALARQRTAMYSAAALEQRFASEAYRAEYKQWAERFSKLDQKAESTWLDTRLMPDPEKVRLRVYATQSTHKSLSALRQGSMFHVYDQDYERKTQDQMIDAYLTHTSTSPNHQIVASLDLARRQADFEGYAMVRSVYQMALALRERVSKDALLSKYFRILEPGELIPAEFRPSGLASYVGADYGAVARAWREDEFVLDPTRITLYLAQSGYNGAGFRSLLLDEYGIQHNKTSINSVLLIFTIGVTWGTMAYLLDSLRKIAERLEHEQGSASDAERELFTRKIKSLTSGLPPLPSFSHFHGAFRPNPATSEGDMRGAYFLNYDVANREYVKLADAIEQVKSGRELVSTNLVVPYPPGFPVLVPGQVVSAPILDFMQKLDVKEVHGYHAAVGLSVFTEKALSNYAGQAGRSLS